jgi:hypothetical protein
LSTICYEAITAVHDGVPVVSTVEQWPSVRTVLEVYATRMAERRQEQRSNRALDEVARLDRVFNYVDNKHQRGT